MSLDLPTRANADVIDAAYKSWTEDPASVSPDWSAFFQGFTFGQSNGHISKSETRRSKPETGNQISDTGGELATGCQVRNLIQRYRAIGHLQAHLDPLEPPPPDAARLALSEFELTESDLDVEFDIGDAFDGGRLKLRDLIARLRQTYSSTIGVEYTHIQDTEMREWLQRRMESTRNQPGFAAAEKIRILRRLHKAELFEHFLHTKYVGQKRFSLEGGETFIAALDALVEACPGRGVEEIGLGMAHRGRLNVLTSILRKPFDVLFEQFSENFLPDTVAGDGDVKYHLGYQAVLDTTGGGKVDVRLAANPSHLEVVGPVVEGNVRARQRVRADTERRRVLPFIVHGDAAIAGQGVVAETLNFSQLAGYRTGGTIHFVINNQIGFTTLPKEARSTRYCTDVAKMIEAPVLHVNGDDPEMVCMAVLLAFDFRLRFQRDVMVDMFCYRKHGHNEGDEPMFTQPMLYRKIAGHRNVSAIYTDKLIAESAITAGEGKAIEAEYLAALDQHLARAKEREAARTKKTPPDQVAPFRGSTAVFQPPYKHTPVVTGVSREMLETCVRGLTHVPANFKINPKIRRQLDARAGAFAAGGPIDWGFGEALAFGTLLLENIPVRLSGQDSERGTFSSRHAVLYDIDSGESYVPLKNLSDRQAQFCVYNSLLSEFAILAFEYGYSADFPEMLCLWEAQFGDFANGAQVVIDQFIASGESKWQRRSGIVLLLPHGYEGQGPEHSSARIERFLQLCGENNMQVAYPTTPASYFHLLRRQKKRDFQKPLVVMTPKSLLRHPAAVSQVSDFTDGSFLEVLDDPGKPAQVDRVILCTGKVYYDLTDFRKNQGVDDAAIIRLEQLYPLNENKLSALSDAYGHAATLVWCQEEPENMGAWRWIAPQLERIFGRKPAYAGREAAASPAVGALAAHRLELSALLRTAFTI